MNIQRSFSHTDLALELKDELEESLEEQQAFDGIKIQQERIGERGLQETVIEIDSEEGEKQLGKPRGIYVTLEGENMAGNDGSFHEEMSECLAKRLQSLLSGKRKLLFIGLGNGEVTPDALGPLVIKNLFITRHLTGWKEIEGCPAVAALAPGVMAQANNWNVCQYSLLLMMIAQACDMEAGELVEGIVKKIHPDALVVIDALAAKSSERLNRTIQISNTGIAPGSGVGNHRNEITEKTMGIPVIAIGVPTVISIPSLAYDIMEAFCASQGEGMEDIFCSWPEKEKYHFLGEILDEKLWELFVTPKEIDEAVKRISYTLSEGINQFVAGRIF